MLIRRGKEVTGIKQSAVIGVKSRVVEAEKVPVFLFPPTNLFGLNLNNG